MAAGHSDKLLPRDMFPDPFLFLIHFFIHSFLIHFFLTPVTGAGCDPEVCPRPPFPDPHPDPFPCLQRIPVTGTGCNPRVCLRPLFPNLFANPFPDPFPDPFPGPQRTPVTGKNAWPLDVAASESAQPIPLAYWFGGALLPLVQCSLLVQCAPWCSAHSGAVSTLVQCLLWCSACFGAPCAGRARQLCRTNLQPPAHAQMRYFGCPPPGTRTPQQATSRCERVAHWHLLADTGCASTARKLSHTQ